MVKAVRRAVEIGATTIQVFGDNPTAWRRRQALPAELPAFRDALAGADIAPLAMHGPYLVNLAGADDDLWDRSLEALIGELHTGAGYGAAFVNIHLGSHRGAGTESGIARVARGVAWALAGADPTPEAPLLVLENSAGGGDGIGGTIEEMAAIQEAVAAAGAPLDRTAFCLDTAHLWAAGYEISRPEEVDRVLERFDAVLGPGRIAMIHLNDAKTALGSHSDRHQHVGAGSIGPAGMARLLTHPQLADVPYYLETPGMDEGYDAVNMERIRLLIAGERLPDLPPEAHRAKGARSRTAPRPE